MMYYNVAGWPSLHERNHLLFWILILPLKFAIFLVAALRPFELASGIVTFITGMVMLAGCCTVLAWQNPIDKMIPVELGVIAATMIPGGILLCAIWLNDMIPAESSWSSTFVLMFMVGAAIFAVLLGLELILKIDGIQLESVTVFFFPLQLVKVDDPSVVTNET